MNCVISDNSWLKVFRKELHLQSVPSVQSTVQQIFMGEDMTQTVKFCQCIMTLWADAHRIS